MKESKKRRRWKMEKQANEFPIFMCARKGFLNGTQIVMNPIPFEIGLLCVYFVLYDSLRAKYYQKQFGKLLFRWVIRNRIKHTKRLSKYIKCKH